MEKRSRFTAEASDLVWDKEDGDKNTRLPRLKYDPDQPREPGGDSEGGRFAPAGGGGGGAPEGDRTERLRDRIEGTQAEADREVTKYEGKAKKARAALEDAKDKRTISGAVAAKLSDEIGQIDRRKAELADKLKSSQARLAALRAKLGPKKAESEEGPLDEIERVLDDVAEWTAEIRGLSDQLDDILSRLTGKTILSSRLKYDPDQPREPAGTGD